MDPKLTEPAVGMLKAEVECAVLACETRDASLNIADEIDSLIGWLQMWRRNALDRARRQKEGKD